MVEIKISEEQIARAQKLANQLGVLKGSITKGNSNLIGMCGEVLISDYLKCELTPTYDYDLVVKELKLDVKTKGCTCTPYNNWEASIADWNTRQKCDGYIFVRVEHFRGDKKKLTKRAWIFGWIPKQEYFELANFCRKGDIDPNGNGWTFKADCYNLLYTKLRKIEELL